MIAAAFAVLLAQGGPPLLSDVFDESEAPKRVGKVATAAGARTCL